MRSSGRTQEASDSKCLTRNMMRRDIADLFCSIFCRFKCLQTERETEVLIVCLKRIGDSSSGYVFVIL